MRMVLLCAATFAAGLLAGAVLWPDEPPTRSRAPVSAAPGPSDFDASDDWEPAAPDDDAPETARARRRVGRNADVRTLTREAAAEIERIAESPTAQATLAGEGKVTGTVRDPTGQPVAGVVITAIPETQPFGLAAERREARQRAHEDRDLADVASEAIELELWRRYARRVATSGPDGRFALTGLMDAMHSLTAFHDDFDVKPLARGGGRVQPDAVVDFLARPVAEVPVEVRLPEGGLADHAWVQWQSADGRGQEAWLQRPGTVRLPTGAVKVKALRWVPEPLESEQVEVQVRGDAPNQTLVLPMKGRRVLTARLELPEGFVLPRSVEYRLRLLTRGSDDVDPESLLKDQSQRRAYSRAPGVAYWFDLEPGRYLVAAFLDKRRLLGHAVAEVGDGMSEVTVPVTEPDGVATVTVRLLGPDGGPVPGQANFRVVAESKGRTRTRRVDALQRDDGSWAVYLDGVEADPGTDATLRVGSPYGGATRPINLRGGGTITIRLDQPALVKLNVDRYAGSGVEGSLYAALRGAVGADAWQLVAADGQVDFKGVQPGDYKLELWVRRRGTNWVLTSRPVRLRSGEDELAIAVPPLHTLRVRWNGRGRPRTVQIRCRDENLTWFRRDARFDDNGAASFELLAAGTYEVRIGRVRKTVRVPGTEVVLP